MFGTKNGRGPVSVATGRPKSGATTYYTLPGVTLVNSVGTLVLAASTVRYHPIFARTPITLDQLALEVTSAGAGGTTARLGIYNADSDWQPTSLLVDAGTVAVDGTGVLTKTVAQTLLGRYLLALNTDGTPTVRVMRGMFPDHGLLSTITANPILFKLSATQSYAAYPASGLAWDTVSGSTVGLDYPVLCRVSVP